MKEGKNIKYYLITTQKKLIAVRSPLIFVLTIYESIVITHNPLKIIGFFFL